MVGEQGLLLGAQDLREPRQVAGQQILAGGAADHQEVVDQADKIAGPISPSLKVEAAQKRRARDVGAEVVERDLRFIAALEQLAEVRIGYVGGRDLARRAVKADARVVNHLLGARVVAVRRIAHRRRAHQMATEVVAVGITIGLIGVGPHIIEIRIHQRDQLRFAGGA
jgi:hypothetical protein